MDETAQGLENPFRQRRTIMPPTPNGHFGNSKQSGDRGITAKGHEYSIELTARHAALEARSGYGFGTGRHGSPKDCSLRPLGRDFSAVARSVTRAQALHSVFKVTAKYPVRAAMVNHA